MKGPEKDIHDYLRPVLGGMVLVSLALTFCFSFFGYVIPSILWWATGILMLGGFTWFVIQQNMIFYVFKRIAGALVVLWVIATLTFLTLRLIPGGPFDEEKALLPEIKAAIEAKYHLDKPLIEQYWMYISGVMQGDFGQSYKYLGRTVTEIVSETFPNTFQLGTYALIVAFLIGIPAGLFSASRHNTLADNATMMFAISGVSLPSFLVAPIMILIFSYGMGWLPPALWAGPEYFILPMIVLGTRPAAAIARLTRASVLDVIHSDYIRTARTKGLSERTILFKHVLKNSLIPVLSYSGPLIAGILSGSFIVEQIFAIPGIGKHLIQSVNNRDYPLILALTLLFSCLLVFANLITDLLYSYFDPRINLS